MMLLWKAVVSEVGGLGMQAHTQKFWFAENLGNIPDNPHKNGAQNVAWLQKTAPKVCRKHM